ncbi:hypothetical protein Ancab_016994, partial [Ancistrocladus abbreviatus]
VVIEEAHNQLGPATKEEGTLDAVCVEPSNKINYYGPKSAYQNLEESAIGPDFYMKASECSPLLISDFRRTLWRQGSGVKHIRKL